MSGRRALALALLAAAVPGCASKEAKEPSAPAVPAVIVQTRDGGRHRVTVEIARTDQERARGMMERSSLPQEAGMLFLFAQSADHGFWMKNTFIPLDMIFIRSDGRILRIAENTEPHSEKIISSGGLAKGVLEVIGGTARKYGIQPGDRVAHPLFGTR